METKNEQSVGQTHEQGQSQGVAAVASGSALPIPPDRWVPVDAALSIIRDPRWIWPRNARCKYIELRVDTRNGKCLISDRDGNEITLRELSRQLDDYLLPNNKISNSGA